MMQAFKRLAVGIAAAILMLPLVVSAQDETLPLPNSLCQFDVSNAVALLTRAQAAAARGEDGIALDYIAQADTLLNTINTFCDLAEAPTPETLPQQITAGEGERTFTIGYPEGWVAQPTPGSTLGSVTLASDAEAAALMTQLNPPLGAGQAGFLVLVGTIPQFTNNTVQTGTLETLTRYYQVVLGQQFLLEGAPELFLLNGRAVGALNFVGDSINGTVRIVELVPGERYGVLAGAAALGEGAALLDLANAVAASIQLAP